MQFRVEPGLTLAVPAIPAEEGDSVVIDRVLLLADGDEVLVGTPHLEGITVEAEVVEQGRDEKVLVYKRKRRKGYERTRGHRQGFTRIAVKSISRA